MEGVRRTTRSSPVLGLILPVILLMICNIILVTRYEQRSNSKARTIQSSIESTVTPRKLIEATALTTVLPRQGTDLYFDLRTRSLVVVVLAPV